MSDFVNRMKKIANGGKDEPLVKVEKATFSGTLPEIARVAPKGIVAQVLVEKFIATTCEAYGSPAEKEKFAERMKKDIDNGGKMVDIVYVTHMLANMIEMDMRGEPVDMEKAAEEAWNE